MLNARAQISTLEDEASELAKYIKGKGKAVEVRDKEMTVSRSRGKYINGKGNTVEVWDKEAWEWREGSWGKEGDQIVIVSALLTFIA